MEEPPSRSHGGAGPVVSRSRILQKTFVALCIALLQSFQQELYVAIYHAQGIVEIVRNRTDDLSGKIKSLSVTQRFEEECLGFRIHRSVAPPRGEVLRYDDTQEEASQPPRTGQPS
jgi:hypothetical protein